MNEGPRRTVLTIAVFILASIAATEAAQAQTGPPQTTPASPAPKTAEQVYKNIQALKGIPADEVIPAMQFISDSLGVGCEHCHMEHAFDKDDKKPKQTARKMIQMQFAINKENFHDHPVVTCNSCHHGAREPAAIPMISEEPPKAGPGPGMPGPGMNASGPNATPLPALPTADQLLQKYVQALGGADALQKITTRVEKGTLTGFGPNPLPVEIFAKAPDKRLSLVHTPNGESGTGYDGHVGWMGFPGRPPREITGGDLDAARLDADFYPTHLKQNFSFLRVVRTEKAGAQDAYLVLGMRQGQPPVELYFDQQSGLLLRMVHYVQTPLGRDPTETDYADYRDADGVKIPYRWTVARPLQRFTIQVDQVQQNAPVDDAKFAKPPAPSEAAQPKPPGQ